jgi:hypothetical protein
LILKITVKRDLIFFYVKKSNGIKEPRQLSCYLVANGKHTKTRIFCLEQEEGTIEGEENFKKFITNYYKGLFGERDSNNLEKKVKESIFRWSIIKL